MTPELGVRGGANAEELAAVLAVVARRGESGTTPGDGPAPLARWRSVRREALKVTATRS